MKTVIDIALESNDKEFFNNLILIEKEGIKFPTKLVQKFKFNGNLYEIKFNSIVDTYLLYYETQIMVIYDMNGMNHTTYPAMYYPYGLLDHFLKNMKIYLKGKNVFKNSSTDSFPNS